MYASGAVSGAVSVGLCECGTPLTLACVLVVSMVENMNSTDLKNLGVFKEPSVEAAWGGTPQTWPQTPGTPSLDTQHPYIGQNLLASPQQAQVAKDAPFVPSTPEVSHISSHRYHVTHVSIPCSISPAIIRTTPHTYGTSHCCTGVQREHFRYEQPH